MKIIKENFLPAQTLTKFKMPKKAAAKKAAAKKTAARKSAARKPVTPAPPFFLSTSRTSPPPSLRAPSMEATPMQSVGDSLLVCIQDPFDRPGTWTKIGQTQVPCYDGQVNHQWRLQAVLEANAPRFFEGWATRGNFSLDIRVNASVSAGGGWGSQSRITSGIGNCRLIILRDGEQNVRFSVERSVYHPGERRMPHPEQNRYFNADIAFQPNGASAISVGATSVVSELSWPHLIAGSNALTHGLAFDSDWRENLKSSPEDGTSDGAVTVSGSYAFAVMDRSSYSAYCSGNGMLEHII